MSDLATFWTTNKKCFCDHQTAFKIVLKTCSTQTFMELGKEVHLSYNMSMPVFLNIDNIFFCFKQGNNFIRWSSIPKNCYGQNSTDRQTNGQTDRQSISSIPAIYFVATIELQMDANACLVKTDFLADNDNHNNNTEAKALLSQNQKYLKARCYVVSYIIMDLTGLTLNGLFTTGAMAFLTLRVP